MTFALKLTHDEPRLVELALVYHLARPGSELDPDSKQPVERGLRSVYDALVAQDGDAVIELDAGQYRRLLSAIYGCSTELRGHHMRGGRPGTFPRFDETARTLFPSLAGDTDAALELAEAMVMLHRRIERAVSAAAAADRADEAPPRARRWPFPRGGKNST